MPSSDFTVNGASLPQLISVAWGASVSCAIVSAQGLSGITWSVIGKSRSSLATPTLTPAGSPPGSTMTFSIPAEDAEGAVGASYLIECSVTYTVGSRTETAATTAVIGVAMDSGVVPGCLGETTERGVYGWLQLLNSGASGALSAPATDYEVPYSSGSVVAWSSTVLMGGTWIGLGAVASQPDSGSLRLAHGSNITTAGGVGGSIDLFFARLDVAQVDLYVGTGSLRHHYVRAGTDVRFVINAVDIAGFTSAGLDLGGHQLSDFTIDALDLTGIDVQTSSGSIETLERGVAALDAGADGAPVAVVAYTVPVGYKATLRCWVCGETNSTQVPAFDTQWIIKCYRKTGGNVTQYAAAVTPNDEADPTTASVAVTYGLSGGVVTLYKANTSGTAMRFSGQIVVSLDALVGAGA